MRIELNAQNIKDYGIAELTGNSEEELLKAVTEAELAGQILWFKIPDAASSERRMNVFEHFNGKAVSPEDLEHGTNPIEQWDGKEIPPDAGVRTHSCVFPPDAEVLEDEIFTCPACRLQFYPELSDTRTHIVWIPVAELD